MDKITCGTFGGLTAKGKSCGLAPGFRTTHPGTGKCNRHGGGNQKPHILMEKYGIESAITFPQIADLVDKLSQDKDIFNIREHIHVLEAISLYLINEGNMTQATKTMVEATKAVSRLHEIEVGRRLVVTLVDVGYILEQIVQIVNRYVLDEHQKALIAQEMTRISLGAPKVIEGEVIET